MKKWRCSVCGYVHEGNSPPDKCPVCGAPREKFNEVRDAESKYEMTARNETDVVVVGSGAAAFAAAITAKQLGLDVVMLEKAEEIGGTTARSGGGFWIPNNRHQRNAGIADDKDDAVRYMARYSYPNLYNPSAERLGLPKREYALIEAYYDRAAEMLDFLEAAGAFTSIMEINWLNKPQVDYMDHLPENKRVRGRTLYSTDDSGGLGMGDNLIRAFVRWARTSGIEINTAHEVTGLTREGDRVTGVTVRSGGEERVITARRGVIYGSGGYSHNPEYMLAFQRGPHYGGCAVPTNTGDFIAHAGTIGAALGNMAGAFRAQSMIDVYLKNPDGSSNVFYIAGDSVLEVNKYGVRVMDEKRNYTDRAMLHFVWDPVACEWTNMLLFMIFDERTATLWQGYPPYPVKGQPLPDYLIAGDTLDALADGIAARLAQLAPHTGNFALSDDFLQNLKGTVRHYNECAVSGTDDLFHRGEPIYDREWTTFPPTVPGAVWPDPDTKNHTMYPLSDKGPYYAIVLAAGTLDTSGGPLTDERARVLNWSGAPIPGLYGAGNAIASPTANAYWGAGSTIGPAMTMGYLAAKDAAGQ